MQPSALWPSHADPLGVVAARQVVAALVLNTVARPRLHRLTRTQWWPIALLALFFAGMNTALYTAVDRIGLGMAVTIEFLGPLAVALGASRKARDVGCAAIALLGVILLTRPNPTSDFLGLGIALFAAVCWAGYILTNRVVGQRVPGLTGTAAATILSSIMTVPFAIGIVISVQPPVEAYLFAAAAGLLSTAVPYSLDLIVLRHQSAGVRAGNVAEPAVRRADRGGLPRGGPAADRLGRDQPGGGRQCADHAEHAPAPPAASSSPYGPAGGRQHPALTCPEHDGRV